MKLFAVVFLAAFVTVSLTQEADSATNGTTTVTPSPPSSSTSTPTTAPTSSTTSPTPSTSTTTKPTPTTRVPTTSAPTTSAPTTSPPTSTTPAPKPEEPTLSNYTLLNKDKKVCAVVITKVVATQNATSYPFVNGTLLVDDDESSCNETQATLLIQSVDGYKLQIVIETNGKTFFVRQLSVEAAGLVASRDNLEQFDTPKEQYYKCAGANQVSLEEQDVKLIFSDMKYQAFRNPDTADFVGSEFECVSDYHSDVVIIAIGCALALLVVVILVAYLIARRRNRQRGYQSV